MELNNLIPFDLTENLSIKCERISGADKVGEGH